MSSKLSQYLEPPLEAHEFLRMGREVELAARAAHVDAEHGAPILPVADADEAAVAEDGRQDSKLNRILRGRTHAGQVLSSVAGGVCLHDPHGAGGRVGRAVHAPR